MGKHRKETLPDLATAARKLIRCAPDRQILISPCMWRPSDGTAAKRWYFIAASQRFTIEIDGEDADHTQVVRAQIMVMLAQLRGPRGLVIQSFDDELKMVEMCAALWTAPKWSSLVDAIREERRIEGRL